MTTKNDEKILTKRRIILGGVMVLAALLAIAFVSARRDYQLPLSYLSGDEPHYVMMADSLVKDGDFNLRNDYDLGRSTAYYPGPSLTPHLSPLSNGGSDKWYSIHTIGVPLVIAVPYKLFGVEGARVWMMLLQSSLVLTFYLVLRKYLKSNNRALIGASLLLACPLFWQNLGSLFPDLLIVSLWMAAIVLFGRRDVLANAALVLISITAGLAHTKGLILVAPLALAHFLLLVKGTNLKTVLKQQRVAFIMAALGVVLYIHFLYSNYGIFTPSALYGNNGQIFGGNLLYNSAAMLTDRNKGSFVNFPLLLVVFPYLAFLVLDLLNGIRRLVKKFKPTQENYLVTGLLVGLGVLLVTVVGFEDWSGSTAPNGRNMLPFVIVAIFAITKYVSIRSRIELFLVGSLAILSAWISWLSIIDFKTYMSPGVNSFWVDRFQPLLHAPLFGFVSTDTGRVPLILASKLLVVILLGNVALFVFLRYRIVLKKRIRP